VDARAQLCEKVLAHGEREIGRADPGFGLSASQSPVRQMEGSMRALGWLAAAVVVVGLMGCDKGGEAAKPGASAAPAGDTKSAGSKKPTTLTYKQMGEAYKNVNGIARMSDSWDKKKAELIAKLGQPAKTEGDFLYWYGVGDPDNTCYEMKMSEKQGSEMGGTDKSKCGL
jgi:hypothetical protein